MDEKINIFKMILDFILELICGVYYAIDDVMFCQDNFGLVLMLAFTPVPYIHLVIKGIVFVIKSIKEKIEDFIDFRKMRKAKEREMAAIRLKEENKMEINKNIKVDDSIISNSQEKSDSKYTYKFNPNEIREVDCNDKSLNDTNIKSLRK